MRAALLAFVLICLGTAACQTVSVGNTLPTPIQNVDGLRVMVAAENTQPSLRIVLSGHPDNDPAINVIFPEHVTAKRQGDCEPEHFQNVNLCRYRGLRRTNRFSPLVRTGKSTPGKPNLDGQSCIVERGQLPENWPFDRCVPQKISLLSLHHQ
jgi:hypothetical protein